MPTNPISGQAGPIRPGGLIYARDLNRVGDSLWQNLMVAGANAAGGRFAGGSFIYPIAPPGGGGAPAVSIKPPWYPFLTQDMSGNYEANFFPGTIAGLLATGWNAPLALTQSAVNYIYLACTATGPNITGATLTASTSYPALAGANSGSAPASFNIPLAIADLTGTASIVNVAGFGNIWAQPYAALFDTINTGALLTAPFTVWYNWEWGAGQD